ncbi:MAG: dTMP kinase [bacterium]
MFITFEGGEGCGKSTHSKLLKRYLAGKGFKVVLTLEPGGTDIGKNLRQVLLKGKKLVSKYSELFLFAADRAEHMERIINPALKSGKIVISDRFIDSTTAYQAGGRMLPANQVKYINKISSNGMVPDLTFLLDIAPQKGILRGTKYSGKDKFESENGGFHARVRSSYLKIAKQESRRVKVVSTGGTVAETQNTIRRIVDEKLRNKK